MIFSINVKRFVGYVPFTKDAVAMYFCMIDSRTQIHVKGTIAAALGYFLSPVDAIPDVIAGMGFTDDVSVIETTNLGIFSIISINQINSFSHQNQSQGI